MPILHFSKLLCGRWELIVVLKYSIQTLKNSTLILAPPPSFVEKIFLSVQYVKNVVFACENIIFQEFRFYTHLLFFKKSCLQMTTGDSNMLAYVSQDNF